MSLLSLDQIKTLYDDLRGRIEDGGSVINFLPVDNASGSIASFPDGADNVPVKSLIAQITPLQSGSGDPAPDNIRPISGWTGAKITRTGKNLVTGIISDVNISAAGMVEADVGHAFGVAYAPIKAGEEYTVTTNDSSYVYGFYTSVPQLNSIAYDGARHILGVATFTAPIDGYVAFRTLINYATPQMELGSSATTYEAPAGSVLNIDWTDEAGTVYGGTLTYIGGGKYSLQATKGYADMGTLTWIYNSGSFYTTDLASVIEKPASSAVLGDYLCSALAQKTGNAQWDLYQYNVAQNKNIWAKTDGSSTDPTTFKNSLSGVQLVYALDPLPDPIILDAEDVKTLLGDNNIFVDTGDVSVDYRADIALYIQKVVNA